MTELSVYEIEESHGTVEYQVEEQDSGKLLVGEFHGENAAEVSVEDGEVTDCAHCDAPSCPFQEAARQYLAEN